MKIDGKHKKLLTGLGIELFEGDLLLAESGECDVNLVGSGCIGADEDVLVAERTVIFQVVDLLLRLVVLEVEAAFLLDLSHRDFL